MPAHFSSAIWTIHHGKLALKVVKDQIVYQGQCRDLIFSQKLGDQHQLHNLDNFILFCENRLVETSQIAKVEDEEIEVLIDLESQTEAPIENKIEEQDEVKIEEEAKRSNKKGAKAKDIKQKAKNGQQIYEEEDVKKQEDSESSSEDQRERKKKKKKSKSKSKSKSKAKAKAEPKSKKQKDKPLNSPKNEKAKTKKSKKRDTQSLDKSDHGVKIEEDQTNEKIEEQELETKRRHSSKQKVPQRKKRVQGKEQVINLVKMRKQREQIDVQQRVQRVSSSKFGLRFDLTLSLECKHSEQYRCTKSELEKKGKLYSQIYNSVPLPKGVRTYFSAKIARLTFQSVTVGVITPLNFDYQYSRDKQNCICFDAYTHSIYVEGEKYEMDFEIKLNDVIRTVIDSPSKSIQWFINNQMIFETKIPQNMLQQQLYPFFEISNKWIKLKINED